MEDIKMSVETAVLQASMTADEYLKSCIQIVFEKTDGENFELVKNAIELTKVCAQDFHTSILSMKLQEIRDELSMLNTQISMLRTD